MTINYLPETDVLSAEVNPLLDEVSLLSAEDAELVEFGATTVIQMLRESARELREATGTVALLMGQDPVEAKDNFTLVYETLTDGYFTPRTEALRSAVQAAYDAEHEAEQEEAEEQERTEEDEAVEAIDNLMESLFAQMFGADAAAETRARIEAARV